VVTFFVEHKTTFTSSANKMHTSVAQSGVIHPEEIRSVLKINLHGAKLHFISLNSIKKEDFVKILVLFVKLIS
jgi:hypothetical protein